MTDSKNLKRALVSLFSVPVLVLMSYGMTAVQAEETTGEKVENKADEMVKDTKVGARNMKKKIRKQTCTDADKAAGKCAMDRRS